MAKKEQKKAKPELELEDDDLEEDEDEDEGDEEETEEDETEEEDEEEDEEEAPAKAKRKGPPKGVVPPGLVPREPVKIPKGMLKTLDPAVQKLLSQREKLLAAGDKKGLRKIRMQLRKAGFRLSEINKPTDE
jgi:hypothetical protein